MKLALPPDHGGAMRELPNGRGFLRVVGASGGPTAPQRPSTPPQVVPSPVAPVAVPIVASAATDPSGQLDLFAWRPKPAPKGQLNLFGDPMEGV